MGSIPSASSEGQEFDDVRPEDSASQVGGQYLGTMSAVGGTVRKTLPAPPPPPPMSGSPKQPRSRPGKPPMQPPKLPAKFSQDPPQPETIASASQDASQEAACQESPPPKKAKASEPTEIKGSVGRVQPRTPSPKRAVEEMARNDAAARGSAPARAEVAKAAPVASA